MAEKRKKEEEQQQKKLAGRMHTFFNKLHGNYTPRDWAIAGLELGSGRCRTLATYVAYNTTLTCLNLSRIGLTDDDGISIA